MKLIFFLTLFACTFALNKKALEIHIFNVGQADSQLIVFPSGYSILIDCGDRDYKTLKNTKHVATRIEKILGKKKVDVLILSHFHGDHSGVYGVNGIWYLMEKAGFTFGKFLMRDVGSYKGSKLANCKKSTITWNVVGEMADSTVKFVCYATSMKEKTKLSKIAKLAYRCNKTQITPPDAKVSVTVLARDGMGVKDENGKKLNRNTMNNGKSKVGENDFSICIRLQYEKFVYATCGDLSGSIYQEPSYKYHDTESRVAPMIGEADLLKVNHHGAGASSNQKWCNTLKPTVSVISCGDATLLPHVPLLKRLKGVGSKIYTTSKECNQENINKVGGIVQMGDDVVITVPTGGKTFTVASPSGKNKKTYNIKQNKKAPAKCVAPA